MARSASKVAGGMVPTSRAITTWRAPAPVLMPGCFASARVSTRTGICTGCSADAAMYAELHALSNFSFLRGASHPEELIRRAAELGYTAIALTDECSVAGVVRAHVAAREAGIRLLVGAEFQFARRPPHRPAGTKPTRLRRALHADYPCAPGRAERRVPTGRRGDVRGPVEACFALWVPGTDIADTAMPGWMREVFREHVAIAVSLHERWLRIPGALPSWPQLGEAHWSAAGGCRRRRTCTIGRGVGCRIPSSPRSAYGAR